MKIDGNDIVEKIDERLEKNGLPVLLLENDETSVAMIAEIEMNPAVVGTGKQKVLAVVVEKIDLPLLLLVVNLVVESQANIGMWHRPVLNT